MSRIARKFSRAAIAALSTLALTWIACSDATGPGDLGPLDVREFIATSTAAPAVNDQITLTFGVRRGSEAARIGSAAGVVTFDATALEFISENHPADPTAVVSMALTSPGVLTFAAASADGFTSENIAAVTVKVLKAGAVSSLTLSLTELTDVNMENRKP